MEKSFLLVLSLFLSLAKVSNASESPARISYKVLVAENPNKVSTYELSNEDPSQEFWRSKSGLLMCYFKPYRWYAAVDIECRNGFLSTQLKRVFASKVVLDCSKYFGRDNSLSFSMWVADASREEGPKFEIYCEKRVPNKTTNSKFTSRFKFLFFGEE